MVAVVVGVVFTVVVDVGKAFEGVTVEIIIKLDD